MNLSNPKCGKILKPVRTVYNVSVWNILINISAQFHPQVAEESNLNLRKCEFLKILDEMLVL